MGDSAGRRRAVFLDRDGTVAEEVGYVNHLSRFRLHPFAASAIRRLNEAGIPVIVVTNQSGVAQGMFPESLVGAVHERMSAELNAAGARLDGIYYCPHRLDDTCGCRKPRPGMLEQAAHEHAIDLAGSYVVGDRYADLDMGFRAGLRGILVLTGYGRGEYELYGKTWPRQPDAVVENLAEAVEQILKEWH